MLRRESRRAITALCVVVTLAGLIAVTANRTDVAQAQASDFDVTIAADGVERNVRTSQTTVSAALKEAGVEVNPADLVYPDPDKLINNGMTIKVVRISNKILTKEEPVAFKIVRVPSRELRLGKTQVVSEGKRGLKRLYYSVRYENGVEKSRNLIRKEVPSTPEDKIVLIGARGGWVSRGGFVSRRVMTMHATAYDPGPRSCGPRATGRTCTGMKAGYGVVAVDPRVIKLGTKLYVEGYGFAIAGDRGKAIKGARIDLGFPTYRAAKQYGRKRVTVHILE